MAESSSIKEGQRVSNFTDNNSGAILDSSSHTFSTFEMTFSLLSWGISPLLPSFISRYGFALLDSQRIWLADDYIRKGNGYREVCGDGIHGRSCDKTYIDAAMIVHHIMQILQQQQPQQDQGVTASKKKRRGRRLLSMLSGDKNSIVV